MIFRRYLELQSFSKLVADLDWRGIVTKLRNTRSPSTLAPFPSLTVPSPTSSRTVSISARFNTAVSGSRVSTRQSSTE